ncbi:hypothetical protein [Algoriphagus yeomjeoni]|uniref:Uncharacterized protein n=1 Tax=Algoriphagus yeomjeoni TaxID=291403 RepID=A0A327P4A9_9BACT|nr:hypothetical protein [Algoriphagus yeomjeoni]RAI87129.1 hypothetical protein LV83_03235 [Algoriphagus yeomjeoni]
MELAVEKLRLVKQILEINDDKLISALLNLLTMTNSENSLTEEQHQGLLLGIKQLDEGRRVSLKDFLRK